MGQHWYCNIDNRVSGPFSARDLKRLVAEGRLGPHHHIGKSVTGPWFQASQVQGVFSHQVAGGAVAAESSQPPGAGAPLPPTQSAGVPSAPQPPGGAVPGIAGGPPRVEAGTRFGRRGRIESPKERRRREQKTLIIGSAVATFAGLVLLVVLLITNPFAASPAPQEKPKPKPDAEAAAAETTDAEVEEDAAEEDVAEEDVVEEDAVDAALRKAIDLKPEGEADARTSDAARANDRRAVAGNRSSGIERDATAAGSQDPPEESAATADEPAVDRSDSSSTSEARGDRRSPARKTPAPDNDKPIDSRELLRRKYPGLFED